MHVDVSGWARPANVQTSKVGRQTGFALDNDLVATLIRIVAGQYKSLAVIPQTVRRKAHRECLRPTRRDVPVISAATAVDRYDTERTNQSRCLGHHQDSNSLVTHSKLLRKVLANFQSAKRVSVDIVCAIEFNVDLRLRWWIQTNIIEVYFT